MSQRYLDKVAEYGGSLIVSIGLFNNDVELFGGNPEYKRQPVTWGKANKGLVRPETDILFDVPAGSTINRWVGFGEDGEILGDGVVTQEKYNAQGQYRLLAEGSGLAHGSV